MKRTFKLTQPVTVFLFLSFFTLNTSFAQEETKSRWYYLSELYLLVPSMTGEIGVGKRSGSKAGIQFLKPLIPS